MNSILVLLKTFFVSPCQWSVAFCKFYARNYDVDQKELLKRPAASNIKYWKFNKRNHVSLKVLFIRAELKEAKKVEKDVKSASDSDNEGKKGADAAVDVKKDKPKEVDKVKEPVEDFDSDIEEEENVAERPRAVHQKLSIQELREHYDIYEACDDRI